MKNRIFSLMLLVLSIVFSARSINAQNVAINTTGAVANSSAMLDIDATDMGLLIPRVALVAVNNGATPIAGPATSLLVYNTNAAVTGGSGLGYYYWDGTQWVRLFSVAGSGASTSWLLLGNAGTNAATNFVGTTDNVDLVFRTNNVEKMRILSGGNVGININNPTNKLDIVGGGARTGTHGTVLPLYVTGNLAPGSAGGVGVEFRHDNGTQGIGFGYNTIYATGSNANQDLGMSSRGTGNLLFTTNALERMRVVGNTGYVGIGTTTPIQNLDVNGRINVANGVVQRGTTQITATSDLGLYSQVAGNWIRIATNASPIRFFTDQGGGNSAGTNSVMDIDNANGGGVSITADVTGPTNGTPYARAILDLQSTTKGMLTPRMTTAQRDAMGNVLTEGLLIYNTNTDCFEYWDNQATPVPGSNGFWNSLCDHCDNVVVISASTSGFNLNTYVGGAKAEHYCVFVQAGVTLQGAGNGGGSGAAGNPGFNCSTMPVGASVTLYNYGNILAGGGNGGNGARESDAVCQGDGGASAGGAGGHAIQTINGCPISLYNYGIVRAGGGGGGGAGAGCCSAGGGGGGGAGTPAGAGGAGACYNCTGGFVCGCGARTGCSAAGNAGTAVTPGTGGGGSGSSGSGCSGNSNGGTGATGGANGVAGNAEGTGCCSGGCGGAGGGAAGLAIQGSGSGSSVVFNSGTITGAVNP